MHGHLGTEIHSTEHLECLSLAVNMRKPRKRHMGTLNHHWNNWALGIILHWDPLILWEFRWNCHQQDKCIWRAWPCRTGLMLLMLFMKCWVWKILPQVQMCLTIRSFSLVLLNVENVVLLNSDISQGVGGNRKVLWGFQEENLIFLSIPLSLLNVKHPQKILGTQAHTF